MLSYKYKFTNHKNMNPIGIAVGVAIGVALHNVTLGICIGVALALTLGKGKKKEGNNP